MRITRLLSLIISVFTSGKCYAEYWTQKADLPAAGRGSAIGFAIGNYGYAGTGDTLNDFWKYDPAANSWTAQTPLSNHLRYGATAVACQGYGYAGLGRYLGFLNDWWEYDPLLNAWMQKNNFPGSPREFASAFSIGDFIYVGCGLDTVGPLRDWWKFNPILNTWGPIPSLPPTTGGSFACVAMTIQGKGYVMTGYGLGKGVYEFDPANQQWNSKSDFEGTGRYAAAGFFIGDYGYLGTGDTFISSLLKDFWQYDPIQDDWFQKNDFSGNARTGAVGFTIGSKGYLAFGFDGITQLNDLWEYTPDSLTGLTELNRIRNSLDISPNPTTGKINIQNIEFKAESISLFNLFGENLFTATPNHQHIIELDISSLAPGIYIVQVNDGGIVYSGKVVKQ